MGGVHSNSRYWKKDVEKILVTEKQIIAKNKEFARQIEQEYRGKEILLIGVLKGAFIFLSDLSKELNIPHRVDFVKVSSYQGTQQCKIKEFQLDVSEELQGRHVIIVEDCIDSGATLTFIKEDFQKRKCESVKVMCLIDKDVSRKEGILVPDWVGFKVPDVWTVGYGMDLDGLFRTLPCVAELDPKKFPEHA